MGRAEARTSASTSTESWMVPRKTAIRSRRLASITAKGSSRRSPMPSATASATAQPASPAGLVVAPGEQRAGDGVQREQVEDGGAEGPHAPGSAGGRG